MTYLVVTGVDKKNGLFHVVLVDGTSFNVVKDCNYAREEDIMHMVVNAGGQYVPLNFSLDRSGKLKQDCGDFSRFSPRGSAVVLAEIKSPGGRTLGYRLLSCANNICVNLKTEEILQREALMPKNEHFLQNGIVRNNAVNCYPLKPYPMLTMNVSKPAKKPTVKAPAKPASQKVAKSEFSKEQLKELESCKNAGINPHLIANPKLSPEQMRIIWVSKSKGCMSEHFASPKYTPDVMKFYGDRFYDAQTVADCKELLSHPELSVDELSELYLCVCEEVPYSEFIGLSPEEIFVKREQLTGTYWGNISAFSMSDYTEKAINAAQRIREGL